jgi:hypothetical protein
MISIFHSAACWDLQISQSQAYSSSSHLFSPVVRRFSGDCADKVLRSASRKLIRPLPLEYITSAVLIVHRRGKVPCGTIRPGGPFSYDF